MGCARCLEAAVLSAQATAEALSHVKRGACAGDKAARLSSGWGGARGFRRRGGSRPSALHKGNEAIAVSVLTANDTFLS